MVVLFDTSAIAKRYRDEGGRERVEHWLAQAREVVMAAHCKVEVASSLCRDVLDGVATQADFARDMELVERDFVDFSVMPMNARIEQLAIGAMGKNRLRAMDALHIATAQAVRADVFVTADLRQAQVAEALGLTIDLVKVA